MLRLSSGGKYLPIVPAHRDGLILWILKAGFTLRITLHVSSCEHECLDWWKHDYEYCWEWYANWFQICLEDVILCLFFHVRPFFFEGSGYQTSSIKACSWFPHRVGEIDRSRQPMQCCGVSFSAAFICCSQIFKDPERFDTLDTENLTGTAHHVAVAPCNNALDGNMSRTDSSAIYFPFFNDSYCTVVDCTRRPRQTDEIRFWKRTFFVGVRCLDTLLILVLHQILLYVTIENAYHRLLRHKWSQTVHVGSLRKSLQFSWLANCRIKNFRLPCLTPLDVPQLFSQYVNVVSDEIILFYFSPQRNRFRFFFRLWNLKSTPNCIPCNQNWFGATARPPAICPPWPCLCRPVAMYCCCGPNDEEIMLTEVPSSHVLDQESQVLIPGPLACGSFSVSLNLVESQQLGLKVDNSDERGSMILEITEGIVANFNLLHPERAIRVYDRVLKVNRELTAISELHRIRVSSIGVKDSSSLELLLSRPQELTVAYLHKHMHTASFATWMWVQSWDLMRLNTVWWH